ncbi:hypothetical protein BJF86_10155 [Serinicoccus sp. CNJ-927]|nr:hypothetical protein BJF86_10155 [Serinicoccus sp. CNJ-927]
MVQVAEERNLPSRPFQRGWVGRRPEVDQFEDMPVPERIGDNVDLLLPPVNEGPYDRHAEQSARVF